MDSPDTSDPRRRPRSPAPTELDLPGEADDDAPAGRSPFRVILIVGTALVVGVIAIAAATGTVDDLPWGAIIGVIVIMGLAAVADRRRVR